MFPKKHCDHGVISASSVALIITQVVVHCQWRSNSGYEDIQTYLNTKGAQTPGLRAAAFLP